MPELSSIKPAPPTMCALVLEKEPTEANTLRFESFPVEEGIAENYSSKWSADTQTRASEPLVWMWSGGGWSEYTITLEFAAGLWDRQDDPRDDEQLLKAMEAKVRWLQAIAFPKGQKQPPGLSLSYVGDPPYVLLVFGSFMTLRCVCTGVIVKWKAPFHPNSARPYAASVSIQLQRVSGFYPDFYRIKEGVTRMSGVANVSVATPPGGA